MQKMASCWQQTPCWQDPFDGYVPAWPCCKELLHRLKWLLLIRVEHKFTLAKTDSMGPQRSELLDWSKLCHCQPRMPSKSVLKPTSCAETDLMGLQFMPLKVKGQAGDGRGAGLPDRGTKPMEVGICKCLLAGGPLSRVEGQHALQQPQCTSVRLAEVLLQLHAALLPHVDKEAPRLLIPHLQTGDVVPKIMHRICCSREASYQTAGMP